MQFTVVRRDLAVLVVGAVAAVATMLAATNASPSESNAGGQPAVLATSTTADTSGDGGIVFPDCLGNPLIVGTSIVYTGAPPRCQSTTTTVSSTSTASPTSQATTTPASSSTSTSTTSSAPASSTSTAPTTTSTTASTTSNAPTTTTIVSPTTTTAPGVPGCGLASPAFCETFDAPHPVAGTRSGDLDATLWGVSRLNTGHTNVSAGQLNDWYAPTGYVTCTPGTYCATGTKVPGVTFGQAPNDVRVVNGRMFEAVNDGTETKTHMELYPKQPFDWSGRTGNLVFDVSLDAQSPHAAWPEIWITDRPVPDTIPDALWPEANNAIGFTIAGAPGCPGLGVDQFAETRNHVSQFLPIDSQDCLSAGSHASLSGPLNHIHMQITSTTMKVWGTAPGSTVEKLIGSTHFAPLNFTKGLVWLTDAHYNACKFDDQCDHVFAWDNLGFDGPKTYRDYTFDVPDAAAPSSENNPTNPQAQVVGLGYFVQSGHDRVVTTGQAVTTVNTPTSCAVLFNATPTQGTVPDVRINGGTWIHTTFAPFLSNDIYKAFDVTVPCSEVRYGAPNTISFHGLNPPQDLIVTNIDLLLVNAAPVS